jgi:predicted DCC family thiol-disulfide oxidoreductase YuxK
MSSKRILILDQMLNAKEKLMAQGRFKLLYDGECPFCRREVALLKRFDRGDSLNLEDIAAVGFDPARYGLSRGEVASELHGIMPDGRMVRRVDALREAYRAVGLGWLVAPAGLPGIHWMLDRMYGIFARNRVRLGSMFGGRCSESGKCPTRH